MKSILKTVPKDLEMKYNEKFGSEINAEILRDLVPRLVKSLKRYKMPGEGMATGPSQISPSSLFV